MMKLIKIGGSVLTDKKSEKLFLQEKKIREIFEEIAQVIEETGEGIVLVTGAGSIGHMLAEKYIKKGKKGSKSFSKAVVEYQKYLTDIWNLASEKLNIVPFRGNSLFFDYNDLHLTERRLLDLVPEKGVLLISSDTILSQDNYRVLSGDEIMSFLADELKPSEAIFLCDVDGVKIDGETRNQISMEETEHRDIKGGMKVKMKYCRKIAEKGVSCRIVNGLERGNLKKRLIEEEEIGTKIRR